MLKYQEFISDSLLESLVNESNLYFTKDFRNKLEELDDNKISKDLLSVQGKDVPADMTFVSLGDTDGSIKFSQINNIISKFKNHYALLFHKHSEQPGIVAELEKDMENCIEKITTGECQIHEIDYFVDVIPDLTTKSRNQTDLGRLVNKVFPDKYNSKELEEFVNSFKAALQENSRFELVSGEDITYWYSKDNYASQDGELGNSCMRYSKCEKYFRIYTENPEVCRLLILKDVSGDKIKGRALIWKVEGYHDVEYFMDRVYFIDETTKSLFDKWCDKKGYLRKYKNGALREFIHKGKYLLDDIKLTVQLTNWKFKKYPYMDTFKKLHIESGKLHNDDSTRYSGYYIMEDTNGGFENTSGKYSEYYSCMIEEEDAVYSEGLGDYIRRSEAIEVTYGRYYGFYPNGYDSLVNDPFRGWLHKDDAVYSDYYNEYIYNDDEVSVVVHFEFRLSNGGVYYSEETLSSQDSQIVDGYSLDCYDWMKSKGLYDLEFSTDILIYSNVTNKYYFCDYEISVYKTKLGNLSEVDAQLFGVEYKSSFSHKTDIMAYNYDIEDKKDLQKKLEDKIKELEYNLNGQQTKLKFSQAQDEMIETNQKQILEKFKVRLSELKLFL